MISQITLVADILGCIEKQGVRTLNARQINAVIKAATDIFFELRKPNTPSKPRQGLDAWLASDDTGRSSRYMAHNLAGGPACPYAHPVDPGDFGRCYRFLRAVPKRRIVETMAIESWQWEVLVRKWKTLEALWRKESKPEYKGPPKLWERMQELLKEKKK